MMDSTNSIRTNLKKYIKVAGKWRFVPVMKQNGVPDPGTVLIDGQPVRSTTGTFYLEYYENGRRVQRPLGTSPRLETSHLERPCAIGQIGGSRARRF